MQLELDGIIVQELTYRLGAGSVSAVVLLTQGGVPCAQLSANLLPSDVPALQELEREIIRRVKRQLGVEGDAETTPVVKTPRGMMEDF